jgi:hypothetical protein
MSALGLPVLLVKILKYFFSLINNNLAQCLINLTIKQLIIRLNIKSLSFVKV